jgi:hypothetical protein
MDAQGRVIHFYERSLTVQPHPRPVLPPARSDISLYASDRVTAT